MSSLLGKPGERWPLATGIDTLGDCVRRAAPPSWVWIAGFFYPSVQWSLDICLGVGQMVLALLRANTGIELPGWATSWTSVRLDTPLTPMGLVSGTILSRVRGEQGASPLDLALFFLFVAIPLAALISRFAVGLASLASPAAWDRARGSRRSVSMRVVWAAGRGQTISGMGMWLGLQLLIVAATFALFGPLILVVNALRLDLLGGAALAVLFPVLLLLLLYGVTMVVLNLLAYPSLALNRRGAASALTHAWRLVRADPWAILRAALVDLLLSVSILALKVALTAASCGLGFLLWIPLDGLAGVARAQYWARVYSALGGLGPADGIPGLPQVRAAAIAAGGPDAS